MGTGRSLLGVINKDRAQRGMAPTRNMYGRWTKACQDWSWRERAAAWDQWVVDQADLKWQREIMGPAEALGRLSQMARGNIDTFVEIGSNGHIRNIKQDQLKENGHLVKKIASSEGRTNSVSLEMYDAQTALQMVGKHLKLFDRAEEEIKPDKRTVVIPANLIAPEFTNVYRAVQAGKYQEFVLSGGRGSTKSSFASLEIIELLVNNPTMHALALRQVKDTLRDSVYAQLVWAITELGLAAEFKCLVSPMEIIYTPTGQRIYFRGVNDPGKIKSIKPPFGYIGIIWFEELDQYHGAEEVRKVEQSVMRGGDKAYIFKTFNPPKSANNWANKYAKIPKDNQYQHHSTYLTVPTEWLGRPWLNEAEFLKAINPTAYEHEYMGVANGIGGLVFDNVKLRAITDDEISQFDHVLHGLDWGYFPDPLAYGRMHYDAARMTLYIYGEFKGLKLGNRVAFDALVNCGLIRHVDGVDEDQHNYTAYPDLIIADSAEPKSIGDFRSYGAMIRGAEKGPDSVTYSMKWLQSLVSIVIDPERCPEHANEFINYELEQDKNGEFISEYPDKNNHFIDDVRYATNLIWRRKGQ
jgi:PBSX family phage terminase large subunit